MMHAGKTRRGGVRGFLVACAITLQPAVLVETAHADPQSAAAQRDGQHDFDFNIGSWKTKLSRLKDPLSGSTAWVTYEGTTLVREVMGGRANLVELDVAGEAGRIEGVLLRLYNPQKREWSLNFASMRNGTMTPPMIGRFKDGRGEFFAKDTFNDMPILVRFVITKVTPTTCRFEQAFSADDGKTWEVNWIATDTRV
jgi:hypothetical protein